MNLFRFILFESHTNKANKYPPVEKAYQMLMNRKGSIEINNCEKIYEFERPWRGKDRDMLQKIADYLNGLKMESKDGRKILVRLRSG